MQAVFVTPPDAVYGIDFNNIDGVRVDYMNYSGDWEYGAQFTVGRTEADTTISGTPAALELENVVAVSFEATRDWFSARTLLARAKTSAANADFDTFVGGLNQYGAFIPAEFTQTEVDGSVIADNKAWYVTAGMRFGKFTPHITYEVEEADNGTQLGLIAAFGRYCCSTGARRVCSYCWSSLRR